MKPSLSLVVPAFNEAVRLPKTLATAVAALARIAGEAEILVVDDGSTDATADIAERTSSPVPIRVVRLDRNRGKGAAVARGMAEARHSLVAFTDADSPYDLAALEPMLAALAAGETDVAIGSRDLPGSQVNRGYGLSRIVSGKAFSFLTWLAIGLPFRDSQCGLKAFRRDVARDLFTMRTIDGFGFDFEILAAAVANRYRVARFPVHLTHNDDSRLDLVSDSLLMARDLWRVRRSLRRGAYDLLPGAAEARPCPLCGGEDFLPQATHQGFRMVECTACGLWYLNPMPTEATLARLYCGDYFASEASLCTGYGDYAGAADDHRATFEHRLALVRAYIGSGRLLDVGGGFGYLADVAERWFAERWLVELSESAARRISPGHRVVVGSFESADLPERYFDVISMQDCLEHLPEPRRALAKIRALLRPGGALLAVTPNVRSWLARLQGRSWVSLKFPEHVVLYSEATLRRALEESGFAVEHVEPARQYARLDFLASRLAPGWPRFGGALAGLVRRLGGAERRVYVPSGSLAVVATAR